MVLFLTIFSAFLISPAVTVQLSSPIKLHSATAIADGSVDTP